MGKVLLYSLFLGKMEGRIQVEGVLNNSNKNQNQIKENVSKYERKYLLSNLVVFSYGIGNSLGSDLCKGSYRGFFFCSYLYIFYLWFFIYLR